MAKIGRPTRPDVAPVSYKIEIKTRDLLELFCKASARSKSQVVDLALKEYLEKHREVIADYTRMMANLQEEIDKAF